MRRPFSLIIALTLAVAATLAVAPTAAAAPGDLDPFFGRDGVQTAFADGAIAYAGTIDHHDRVLLVGSTVSDHPDVALARFTPAGKLDTTFGGADGRVTTDLGASEYAFGVAIASDGGIVVAGERTIGDASRMLVQRYRPNGTLDPSFGNAGTTLFGFGHALQGADAVAIGPNGRIVVAGFTSNGVTSRSALARLLVDGRLDPSFGIHGRVTVDISPSAERFTDVAIAGDGRIVAGGWAEGSLVPAFSAARFSNDGHLDPSFNGRGSIRFSVSDGADRAAALALEPDGGVILAGYAAAGGRDEWGVARLGPHGHLDPSFGDRGVTVTSFGGGFDEASGVAVQPNGKVVVVGRIHTSDAATDIGVLRLRPTGGHDRTFGHGGRVLTDVGGATNEAHGVVIQSNGKIVVVGDAIVGGTRRFVAARYLSS
jgi:uncharacterized delta-60 repeat protein